MNKKLDITYSTEVGFDHPVWAKPFAQGRLKAFLVPGIRFGREFMELARRMDMDFETVTIDRDWDLNKWGIGEFYDKRGGVWDQDLMYENLENIMLSSEKFDVLVIPGINGWGHFTKKTLEAILKRVEEGAGLVIVKPFNGTDYDNKPFEPVEELEKLSPLKNLFEEGFAPDKMAGEGFPDVAYDKMKKGRWLPKDHYITRGIPFNLFPYDEIAYYPYEARGEVIIEAEDGTPIAAVKEYGKGRIVAFGYYPRNILPQHSDFTGRESFYESIIDNLAGSMHSLSYNYLEYFYGLIYRSMVWAARKEPDCKIKSINKNGFALNVEIINKTASACDGNCGCREDSELGKDLSLYYRLNDSYDNVVFEGSSMDGTLKLPEWLELGGQYRGDVFLKNNDGVLDWQTVVLDFPLKSGIGNISLSCSAIQPGELLTADIDVFGTDGELEIQVLDDYGNTWHIEKCAIKGNDTVKFEYMVERVRSLHIKIRAVVRVDGRVVQRKDSETIIVTPQERSLNDFEVFMNAQNRGQGDMWDLQRELDLELGVTGAFPGSDRTLAMSGAEGLGVYWYHRHPYTERKEKYLTTKDKKYLCRVPCLNDPEFIKENDRKIIEGVTENQKFGPVSYYANDEGSLTCYSDELDLCFCTHCMSKMREWLKEQYKDLDELNKVWGTDFEEWDQVVPYTAEEAIDTRQFASWGDHRRFMELTFANTYKKIRDNIKSIDPKGVIRMSGCQASTAYTGYDYYLLHQYIGYFEAYGVGNQFEFHRSFALPGTIIGGWMGYGARGKSVKNRLWNALYHGLTLISIFCEYSCLNPDFTYFEGALDMAEVFKEIRREGIGKLLLHTAKRDHLGVAIHYSLPSIHGSYIMGERVRFESNRQGWIDLMEDLGYQYNFVASQQIEAGELISKGYKLLILPYSIALSQKETEEIKRFVENGGTVIGDIQTGLMDEHCKLYKTGRLDDVFGIKRLDNSARLFYGSGEFIPKNDFPYPQLQVRTAEDHDLGFRIAEPGIRADSGKTAYVDDFSRRIGVLTVNEYGKGKGIYLNFAADNYPAVRKNKDSAQVLKKFIKGIFQLAGIVKPAVLKDAEGGLIESGHESFYYSDNTAKYVCVIRALDGDIKINYDGLERMGAEQRRETLNSIKVELQDKGHVYDIRTRKYLGYTDKVDALIASGDTLQLSVLPYEVRYISIYGEDTVERGSIYRAEIEIGSDKPQGEYANVLNINVYDPEGQYQWMYSENAKVDGLNFVKEVKLPYNAKKGTWKIVTKDVATGVMTEKEFEVC